MDFLIDAQFLAAGAFLAVGFSHALIYARQPGPKVHLLFALTAFGSAANAIAEAFFYQATSVEAFNVAFKWSNSLNTFWLVALIWFIVVYTAGPDPLRSLGPMRGSVAAALSAVFLVAGIANALMPYGFLYVEITDLHPIVPPWGEQIVVAQGTSNPWRILTDLAFLGVIGLIQSTVPLGGGLASSAALFFSVVASSFFSFSYSCSGFWSIWDCGRSRISTPLATSR